MNQEHTKTSESPENNPFFSPWTTPHETVPFDRIRTEHFAPAIREGIRRHKEEIERIACNPEEPTFRNTIQAMEHAGKLIERAYTTMENLLSAESDDELQRIAEELTPQITEHFNDVSLHPQLFRRIKHIYETEKQRPTLFGEERKLLEDSYEGFVRHGANLPADKQEEYRKLTQELSLLSLQYGQNILKETASYTLHLTQATEVEGMPEGILEAAAHEAASQGKEGWIFSLQAPSYIPFMTYCTRRELREQLHTAYGTRCAHDNAYSNYPLVVRMVNLRREIAQLLGYDTYADYVLCRRMAENKESVNRLLQELLEAYKPTAQEEVGRIVRFAEEKDGIAPADFRPWDFAYYANLLKERDFSLNDELLRPYFRLESVIDGVFGLARRLYGIRFAENKDIPVYHKDVTAYEVFDKDETYLGVLYADFFPRTGKRPGAWMTEYKGQWHEPDGQDSRPHVSLVMNFTKPTADKPALLTLGEVETFLHEFGHSLHGLFAASTYGSLSGTNVYWDFVELPSQFMENFAIEKEFLHTFARHYESGELLPDELIGRIVRARNFNVAYACLRQLSFGFLDMAWYTQEKPFPAGHTETSAEREKPLSDKETVLHFERQAMESTRLLPCYPNENCMSTQFSHIFAGGYAAGYYSYKWAEVLDADAFALFQEKGIFNPEVAESFRKNILSRGGTEHPMTLYKRFRGQEPTIEALLRRNGIKR